MYGTKLKFQLIFNFLKYLLKICLYLTIYISWHIQENSTQIVANSTIAYVNTD